MAISNFEDMKVWQVSQDFAVDVYQATKSFPSSEKFGITNQIQRAVSSISANIAEGFGRFSVKEKLHFYTIAYGSLLETKNFLYLACRLEYICQDDLEILIKRSVDCQKLINACKHSLRKDTL